MSGSTEQETEKETLVLSEGDKRYNMINNYIKADANNYETPETILIAGLNILIDRTNKVNEVISLLGDEDIKTALKEKIIAYKDATESLMAIAKKFDQFNSIIGEENG